MMRIKKFNETENTMKEFIKHSYAIEEANAFFDTIDKDSILELYTELDYVYDLLESMGIVNRYSGKEILKDFTVENGMGNEIYICVGDKHKKLNIDLIVNEVCKMFSKIK